MPLVSRATVSSIDSTRVRIVSTWPASRASTFTAVGLGAGGSHMGAFSFGGDAFPLAEFGAGGFQTRA